MKTRNVLFPLVLGFLLSPPAKASIASIPSFSTGTGTYYAPTAVRISDAATCAIIYYTTDGTTPTTASTVYTGPLTISSTTTLQAMAECPGDTPSAVASATYTMSTPYVPSFNTGTGTYYAPTAISISDGTKCATIYYTTDGSTPSTASAVYSGPIKISSATTLKAFAQCGSGGPSAVTSATYSFAVPYAPAFSVAQATSYTQPVVTIIDATRCAAVYYTTDGSTPTAASSLYRGPLTLTSTSTTLKAIAQCSGGPSSATTSATYSYNATANPSLSTGTGTYYAPVTVSLSDPTSCASIYYTTNGSTPTTASTLYTGPITLSSTATLQAIGVCPGGSPSSIRTATYTITAPYAPSFSTSAGTYYAPTTISLSEATKCATVYYTTDGSLPTTASAVYSAPFTIASTITVRAMAQCAGGSPSIVTTATYTIAAPVVPTLSVSAGTYYAPPTVRISDPTTCATFYYTTDGSTPTNSSSVYGGPITVNRTTTLNVIAQCGGGAPSPVASATYTIPAPGVPSFSVAQANSYAQPVVTISDANNCATLYYTIGGSTPTTASNVYSGPLTLTGATTTLKAFAQCGAGPASQAASATYTYVPTFAPSLSTGTGTYYAPFSVSLSESTACASIYYTTDGSVPTTSSTLYTGPVTISTTTLLQAIGVCPGGSPGPVKSATFTISAPYTPSFSTGTGTYYGTTTVSISEATKCATVYYTVDGSTPTNASRVYAGALTISGTTTVKAMAQCQGGGPASAVATAVYTFSAPYAPVFSVQPGTYVAPPSVSISDPTKCAIVYYSTDGSTPTSSSTVYNGSLTISKSTTLKAIAQCTGGSPSSVTSGLYTIAAPNAPSFSAAQANSYAQPVVTISDSSACANTFYYTTDGTTPTTASSVYSGPVKLTATSTTLSAVAQCAGGPLSTPASATYTYAATAVPSVSTGTGTYYSPFTLTMSEATSCASVYYTTDGTTPSSSSTLYSGPITISSTTTLQAIGVCPGGSPSPVRSVTYTVSAPYPPSFSTGTGTYYAPTTVSISEATKCASVYYTVDGSTPTTASTVYTGSLTISSTTTLKAVSACSGGASSTVTSATYTISTPYMPTFSTGTGTYYAPPTVGISEGTKSATVYYTVDGSTPTAASPVYASPLKVTSTATLKAIAQVTGGAPSNTQSATYTVQPAAAPVFSLAAGTYERSISITVNEATQGAVVYYTTDGTTPTASSTVYTGPITLSNASTFSVTYTVQAVAIYPGGSPSPVTAARYTILAATVPIHAPNSAASFFGMEVVALLNGTPWPQPPIGSLRIFGQWTLWSALNPSAGSYNWASLDKSIQVGQANGVQLLFTLGGTPPWAIPSNLQISQISRSGGVVTVTTAQPHQLYYNTTYAANRESSVTISGVADSSFNGTFVLTGTPSPTTLTFAQSAADGASSGGVLSAVCGGDQAPDACAEAPMNLSDWDTFVTQLVAHVGPGVIKYWELWNEANLGNSWRGDPAFLVSMAADAYRIIKAADPNAIVLSPSTTIELETPQYCPSWDPRCGSAWTARWLAAGGNAAIDGIALHGYPMVNESPEQIQGAVTLMQIAMNQNGVGSLPIVDTESSWGLNTSLPADSDRVVFLARHLLLEESMGVQNVFWYAYDDPNWGQLWTSTAGLSNSGIAYGQVEKWIQGTALAKACAPITVTSTTYTCGYSRPNGYAALAIWDTSGAATFTVPQGYVQYRDLSGNLVPATAGSSLAITGSPILLENMSAF